MPLKIKIEKSFKKDLSRTQKSGIYAKNDFTNLQNIIADLTLGNPIDIKHKRHFLKGNLKGFEAIHIKYDLVLIFKIDTVFLSLVMLGKHTQIYKKFS